jgi:hypothetical protein
VRENIIQIPTAAMIRTMILIRIGIPGGITQDGDFLLVIILGICGDIHTMTVLGLGGIMIITIPLGITRDISIPMAGSFKEEHSIAGLHIKDLIPTIE